MTASRIHLLACDRCRRQLDVSALHVGDDVMCVCGNELVVGPPKIVTVRGLACKRCGGTVGESDTACPYCKAALNAEDKITSTLCPACATRIPNDSRHCKACGVRLRAAAVPALPPEGKCPRCDGELRVHLFEDAELIECADEQGCGGIWCTRETFERMKERVARLETPSPPRVQPPSVIYDGPSNGRAYLPCLTCGELMQRRQFMHANRPSRVVIDVCKNHGVWFDRDELQAILRFISDNRASGLGAPSGGHVDWTKVAKVPLKEQKSTRRGTVLGDIGGAIEWVFEAVSEFSFFDFDL